MKAWHDALRGYRRSAMTETSPDSSRVLFVVCSESRAVGRLVAGCGPAMVLQQLGSGGDWSEPGTRATVEYAIEVARVRRIVVCGHAGCAADHAADGPRSREASQRSVVERCERLYRDPALGRLLREHGVVVAPIWFDEEEGDVYRCDVEGRRATLLSDEDFGRLVDGP
jgi:carbonic anhydrase